jgi:Fe-S-cluster-containing dehydrogenase component/formate-dependent nitrite reductase membrane component NrfD
MGKDYQIAQSQNLHNNNNITKSTMNYGFIIDNRKCIGCHACSTACKAENEVPLSVNRTWVKYVETGAYPDSRRHFQVTRCNHCANPPCVRICPVTAMYQRTDGIVEFDPDICIGCKACMQACPYDAIYIDPESHTAAKCHYCAHRVDLYLEPACVVVCPEHAIISGDMDDPLSEISHMLARHDVTVRKPEQGTAPKLFYIDGNDAALVPTATQRTPETFLWADVIPLHAKAVDGGRQTTDERQQTQHAPRTTQHGTPIRTPQPQATADPIQFGGRMAEHMVQVAYNAQHVIPWHWPVPAYLVTKAIGSGLFLLLSLGVGLGLFPFDTTTAIWTGFASLLFIGITTGLLVYDLERPERFLLILTRPQWKSWLTRGAFILIGFTAIAGLWWLLVLGGVYTDALRGLAATLYLPLLWLGMPFALGSAVYTAFLFGQAEGRDLWQSPLLPIHMLLQAVMAGSGAFLVLDLFLAAPPAMSAVAVIVFAATLVLDLLMTFLGEFGMPHASNDAAKAAHEIRSGRHRSYFWTGSLFIGHVAPLVLLLTGIPLLFAVAGLCAIAGLYFYEHAFVMAPQEIPNS